MKTFLKIILIVNFLFLPALAYAATHLYHVTQKGAGYRTGKSLANAWSVSDFNSSANWSKIDHPDRIDPGDTVYFSGTITSALYPQGSGSSGNSITLDGYEADDTTYMNLSESSGRAKIDRNIDTDFGIYVKGHNHITVQDFEITDINQGIYLAPGSTYIVVKRTYIYECDNGIIIYGASYITIGGSSGHGNVVKNVGRDTSHEDIGITGPTHDVIISYNHLYADSASWGIDGIMNDGANTNKVLIEYNSIHSHNRVGGTGEGGIDIKGNAYDWIIRFNDIYDHDNEHGILLNPSDNRNYSCDKIYIYGNRLHGHANLAFGSGNEKGESHDEIYFFSNLVYNNGEDGAVLLGDSGTSLSNGTFIFNNTFSENAYASDDYSDSHLWWHTGYLTLKNNIFIKARGNQSDYKQYELGAVADEKTDADYNRFYWPSKTSKIDWGNSGALTLSKVQGGRANGLPQEKNSTEGDPGLVDWENRNFEIISTSSAVFEAGIDMGSGAITTIKIQGQSYPVYWDIALGPDTDWSSTIPYIEILRRDSLQWSQGAYVYAGRGFTSSVRPPAPRSLRIIAD
jgi:hypothetical protein